MKWAGLGRRARGMFAAAGAFIWLNGLYVLPLAHNLDHRPDHTHAPTGHSHPHQPSSHAHPHDADHDHEHVHDHEPAPRKGHEGEPFDPDHGEGSLLHFAAVVVGAEPVVVPELSYAVVTVVVDSVRSTDAPVLLGFLARGPPSS